MAFKRRTKRGGGGNRTSVTSHTNKGTTYSSSYSTTGTQRTKSGGARYTTRYNPDGTTTKTETQIHANGYISRKQKTSGKIKQPKIPRAKAPRKSRVRWAKSTSRGTSVRNTKDAITVIAGICIIYAIVSYWQYILLAIGGALLVYILYKFNK